MYGYVPDASSQFDPLGLKIWRYSNMPKIETMELHHVIPKSLKNHPALKAIEYDVNKPSSLIYLPKEFGGYGKRSAHKGYSGGHSAYNKAMRQNLDRIAIAARTNNWSTKQISSAVESLRVRTRQGLRSGKIKCR